MAVLLAAVILVVGPLGGCGGEETTTSATGGSRQETRTAPGGGAQQFHVPGGDNSIQEFGSEGSGSELRAAGASLHGFLKARAEAKWVAACRRLAAGVRQQLQQLAARVPGHAAPACPKVLASLTAGVPPAALKEATIAQVGSLRVQGSRGFLLYRGANGAPYAIKVTAQGGGWKIAGVSGVPLE